MISGTYSLGQKCFDCKSNGDCRNGGSDILAKPGFWRSPPYFQTCIDENTLEVLNSSGSAYNIDARPPSRQCPNSTVSVTTVASLAAAAATSTATSAIVTACTETHSPSSRPGQKSPQSKGKLAKKQSCPGTSVPLPLPSKYSGQASIFRCPGGEAACPDRGEDAKGTSLECGEGYQGVACAICTLGFARAGHQCIECHEDTDHKKWLVVAAVGLVAVLAYYKLLVKGMCTNSKCSPGHTVQVKSIAPLVWLSLRFKVLSKLAKNKCAPLMLKFYEQAIFY